MTNRRQLQYSIPFFFFTKCSEKKTVTDPVKTQSDQISHFFRSLMLAASFPLPSDRLQNALCTEKKGSSAAWTGESYILRQRLDSGRLLTFSFLGQKGQRQ